MKKIVCFTLLYTLLSAGAMSLYAGIYDGIRGLPPEAKRVFPIIHDLSTKTTIEWHHVLGFNDDHIPSDSEIKKACRQLSLKVHPDKNSTEWATEAFQFIQEAKDKKPANSDRVVIDYESTISKKKLVFSLLPKKFISGTAIAGLTTYALYLFSKTKWFKRHTKEFDTFIKEKSSALHATLHVVIPTGIGTGKLAWNLTQIGGGIILCIIGTPLTLIGGATIAVNPKDLEKEVGNERIDLPPRPLVIPNGACYIKQSNGEYHFYQNATDYDSYNLNPKMFEKPPYDSISEQKLRNSFVMGKRINTGIKMTAPLGASLFIVGCHNIASGVRGIKRLCKGKDEAKDTLVLD